MKKRLSSENLYHFTKDAETISKILQSGLRYSFCNESIPHEMYTRNLFNISFCDIRFEESENHRRCYGNNAIVLSKEWGIKNGLSPVRYVHANSPGLSKPYKLSRRNYHFLRGLSLNYSLLKKLSLNHDLVGNPSSDSISDFEFNLLFLFTSILEIEKKIESFDIEKEMKENHDTFKDEYYKLDNEFVSFYNSLKQKNDKEATLLTKYIGTLIYRITELHNELIERDNYTRIYKDEFRCPIDGKNINRILYDEKEWRAIYMEEIDEKENVAQIQTVKSYMNQGFLPKNFNLKFTDKDILAIIANDEKAKQNIIEKTLTETGLLSKDFIENNIYTIKEFKEK